MAHKEMKTLEEEATMGYIHNVSPVKLGNFFECQVQTGSENTVRAVCFSPKKRSAILAFAEKDTPIEIKKYRYETKYNSEDIVMDEDTVIEKCDQVDFPKASLPDANKIIEISKLKSLTIGQLVNVKGKVVNVKAVKEVKPNLKMMEVNIVDTTETIKLVLWQNFIDQVEVNKTYVFENVRLKKIHILRRFTLILLKMTIQQ